MPLIKLLDETNFIGIQYPDGKYISVRKTYIKQVGYNETNGDVVIVEQDNKTISFNYIDVEDPLNLENSFFSVYALWVYLLNMMGAMIPVPQPPQPPSLPNIKYGYLYNWYAASNSKFAPEGWHVPTQTEFETLISYIGGVDSISSGKIQDTNPIYWNPVNEFATNLLKLNSKGSGYIDDQGFSNLLSFAIYWSITIESVASAQYFYVDSYEIGMYNNSFNNGQSIIFIKDNSILVPSLTDLDGNVYRTTKIGNQVWLADNWACTRLNDGTPIPNVTDDVEWAALTSEGYCAYDNDITNAYLTMPVITSNIKYGRLYNWYAASNANFAPVGWHVPTQAEFETLITELGGNLVAGGKLKETGFTYWDDPNTGATNECNFNARGTGLRYDIFSDIKFVSEFYTLDIDENLNVVTYILHADGSILDSTSDTKYTGLLARLIKDDSILVPSLTDKDRNVYRTTKIGDQVWLADNWSCTQLNDGTPIPNVTDNTEWTALVSDGYCNYDNDINNVFIVPTPVSNIKYGALYNWYAASNVLFAPVGWHVPTSAELEVLITELGINDIGLGKLKETGTIYWSFPNYAATNETNFNSRGAGERYNEVYDSQFNYAFYWSNSEFDINNGFRSLNYYDQENLDLLTDIVVQDLKNSGFSIRLIKDDSVLISSLTDLDGNVYRTTKIGNQVWLADNWACTKLSNGNPIPNVTDNTDWANLTTGAYCWYNNDINNGFL